MEKEEEEGGSDIPMLHPADGHGTGNGHVHTQPPDYNTTLKNGMDDDDSGTDDVKRQHHLLYTLFKHTWRHLIMSCILSIIVVTCCFAQPLLIMVIIRADPATSKTIHYVCAAGLIIYNFLHFFLSTLAHHLLEKAVAKVRIFLMHAMSSQMTSDRKSTTRDPDITQVIFSMDVDRFCRILPYVDVVVVGPLSLLAAFTLLTCSLGVAPLPALGLALVTLVVRIYCCMLDQRLLNQALAWTTKRISLLKEAIMKIEAIKILCLEDRYVSRLLKYSSREFSLVWKSVYLSAFNLGLGRVAVRLSIYITVVLFVILNTQTTLHSIILVISYIRLLEFSVFIRLPFGITGVSHAWKYTKTFQEFLDGDHRKGAPQKVVLLDEVGEMEMEKEHPVYDTPNAESDKLFTEENTLVEGLADEATVVNDGGTSWGGYWSFVSLWPGSLMVPFIFFFACATEILGILSEWWIVRCRPASQESSNDTGLSTVPPSDPAHLSTDLLPYTLVVGAHVVAELLLDGLSAYMLTSTLKKLHNKMVRSILHSKLTKVKGLSLGNTLSAFSKDIICFSKTGFHLIYSVGTSTLKLFTQLFFICILFPWVTIPTVPYIISLIILRVYLKYKANYTDSQELESNSYITQAEQRQRWFHHLAIKSWFRLRINLLTFIYCVCIILQVVLPWQGKERTGESALVLVYTITLLHYVQWYVGAYDKQIFSLERMQAHTASTPEVSDGLGAWCDWPGSGRLTYRRVCLPGEEGQPPFDTVIPSGLKVGVLCNDVARGRSFLNSLLALEDHPGCVFLDGVNLSTVCVHTLRAAVTVVHPELICSGGYLRDYLDPRREFTDEVLWDTLDRVSLKAKVESLTPTLRLDVGQTALEEVEKQLVGVARAVLHKSQVIVVWTENRHTDIKADYRVQDIIRQLLPQATRIRITPSVRGVVSSDRVLVLGDEQVSEYSNPWRLLVSDGPYYDQLEAEVGPQEAAHLRDLTREFYRETARMDSIPEEDEESIPEVDEDNTTEMGEDTIPNVDENGRTS